MEEDGGEGEGAGEFQSKKVAGVSAICFSFVLLVWKEKKEKKEKKKKWKH